MKNFPIKRALFAVFSLTISTGCTSSKPQPNLMTDELVLGTIITRNGSPFHGANFEYVKDLYIGRLSYGATLVLADVLVEKDEYDDPVIKVKVLSNKGEKKYYVDRVGWVELTDTSFIELYDPYTDELDPERIRFRGLSQSTINSMLDKQRNEN